MHKYIAKTIVYWLLFAGLFLLYWAVYSATRLNKNRQKALKIIPIKRHFAGDTLTMDTVVIRYKAKRKDTALRLGRYRGSLPSFQGQIGNWQQDSIPATMMNKFIDSPLHITSDGEEYRVIRYRFSYRKKDVYLDDQTMSVKTKYELISYYVYGSPLPDKHAKHIRGEVKGAEEFWFEEIMVANKQGEQFFAPNIHIKTYD